MCGICGYIGNERMADDLLIRMNDTMYHRGPDDSGIWQGDYSEDKSIGLAHRRLSILDLSELGHQPILSKDGKWVIVFNGEIYNFKKLRNELIQRGHSFISECDTEVVLESYMEWGAGAVKKLDGMFAIAAYNICEKILYLARDRIGKKPLYYYCKNGELIFSSELKAIISCPIFEMAINMRVLKQYLCKQYVSEPDTFYEYTYKVKPGHLVVVESGNIADEEYWNVYEEYKKGQESREEKYEVCKAELKKRLYEAVEKRLVADVPVGAFLSGGIDSTLITAIANELYGGGIKTFTIGFDDKSRDEAAYAEQTSKLLGTTHTEHYISERDMLEIIERTNSTFDEPFADPSEIPSLLLAEIAKKDVTVALTGDGGDEFFCGYGMYDYLYYAERLDGIAKFGNTILKNPLGSKVKKLLPATAVVLLENREENYKVQLFEDLPESIVKSIMICDEGIAVKSDIEGTLSTENFQSRRMILDMLTYLPEDVLVKADRTSMQHSLELRCPILDRKVMEYSFRIPHKYKYFNRDKKHILKDIVYDYVPKEMMDRPKNGFGVPLGKWLRTFLLQDICELSKMDFLVRQGLFRYEAVQKLIDTVRKSDRKPYTKVLWAYYIFQKWYVDCLL